MATGAIVSSGRIKAVDSGGVMFNTIIQSGGIEMVAAGGETSALALGLGGMLDLASIASDSGTSHSFASSGDGGPLTVISSGTSFDVTLFGQKAVSSFEKSSDGQRWWHVGHQWFLERACRCPLLEASVSHSGEPTVPLGETPLNEEALLAPKLVHIPIVAGAARPLIGDRN